MVKVKWSSLPKEFVWAAMDYNGDVHVFTHRPAYMIGGAWLASQGARMYVEKSAAEYPAAWAGTSLQARPEPVVSEMFSG